MQYARQIGFPGPGETLVVIGETFSELGGSEYLKTVLGLERGKPPRPLPEKVASSARFVQEAIRKNLLTAVHDCSMGGLMLAVTLMSVKGKAGVTFDARKIPSAGCSRLDEILFSESYARYVATCDEANLRALKSFAKKNRVPFAAIGKTTPDAEITIKQGDRQLAKLSLQSLEAARRETIPRVMGDFT